jgi:hypothetical protein
VRRAGVGAWVRAWLCALPCWAAAVAWAQDAELDALSLPGSTAAAAADGARAWQLFAEGAAGQARVGPAVPGAALRATQRLSLDLQLDAAPAPGLRLALADRLDANAPRGPGQRGTVNTLKEAYASWQPREGFIADAGRVNHYSGVALGYNPTDFLRDGALRSAVSVDPASVKRNRQGSVMLRAQALWNGGAFTALYAPRLRRSPADAAFEADAWATNRRDRALLSLSQRLSEDFTPQALLYLDQGAAPQAGLNLTRLLNQATVAYVEWSGGRAPTLLAQALGQDGPRAYRQRASAGLTFTTADKLALTVEAAFNGTGLERAQWRALPAASPAGYAAYRQFAQWAQDMPTRRALLVHAAWQDALAPHLDLAALLRRNQDDGSRLAWTELRYRWTRDEIAWQWQRHTGTPWSEYGAALQRWGWQASYRVFF